MIGKSAGDPGFEKVSQSLPAGSHKEALSTSGKKSAPIPDSADEARDLVDFAPADPCDVDIDPFEPSNDIRKTAYTPPPPEKEWTALIYMAGDNDLEPYLVNNLKSLEKIGSSPRVNILVEMDRGEAPRSPISKWEGSRRLFVQKSDQLTKIESPVVQNLGKVNMSDPEHLADFIKWGMKNYPAKHYLLIINDHGYGFMGAADDKGSNDTMNLPELGKALQSATKETGKKIDILGFDACLMGQVEVAYELKDYADIMIASQEVIGSGGWPYNAFYDDKTGQMVAKGPGAAGPATSLAGDFSPHIYPQNAALAQFLEKAERIIENTGKIDPEVFAKAIVAYCEKSTENTPTMAAIRMGEPIVRIAEKVKELGMAIKDSSQKDVLLEIIKNTQKFNKQSPAQNPYGDYRDLYDFAYNLSHSRKLQDENIKGIAEEIQKAVDDAIIRRISDEALPIKYKNAAGISLYMPDSVGITDYGYGETRFEKDTHWLVNTRDVAQYNPEEKWEPLYKPPEIKSSRKTDEKSS